MEVGHHKIALIFFLHPYIVADGSKIIAEVQHAGAADAAHDYATLSFFHKGAKI